MQIVDVFKPSTPPDLHVHRTLLDWCAFRGWDLTVEQLRMHALNLQKECAHRHICCGVVPSADPRFLRLCAYPSWLLAAYFTAVPAWAPDQYVFPPGEGPRSLPVDLNPPPL